MVVRVVKDREAAENLFALASKMADLVPGVDKTEIFQQELLDSVDKPTRLIVAEWDEEHDRPLAYILGTIRDSHGERFVNVEQLYSSVNGAGKEVFQVVEDWASLNGADYVSGITFQNAEAVARLFGARPIGTALLKDVRNGRNS